MPGSKRRALKKLLSPNSASEPSDPPNSLSNDLTSAGQLPPPAIPTSGASSGSSALPVNGNGTGAGIEGAPVQLTDAEVQESVVLEQMAQREKEIGTGHASPGLNHLSPPPAQADPASISSSTSSSMQNQYPIANGGLPPPPPPSSAAASGQSQGLAQEPMYNSTSSPPPPPASAGGGGMYGGGLANGGGNAGGKKKKSSRQKFEERQARKQEALVNSAPPADPNWTAQLERERQEEIQVIGDACTVLGREIYEIAPDGHCMYSAIADQLGQIGLISPEDAGNYQVTRSTAAQFMLSHPDDFMPFLPSITGEDSAGATDDGVITESGFKKYCQLVAETGEWGGEPEIQALSKAFNVSIHVIQRGPPTIVSHGGSGDAFGGAMTPEQSMAAGDKVVRISYHKRMYGLGEHYNSLRVAQ